MRREPPGPDSSQGGLPFVGTRALSCRELLELRGRYRHTLLTTGYDVSLVLVLGLFCLGGERGHLLFRLVCLGGVVRLWPEASRRYRQAAGLRLAIECGVVHVYFPRALPRVGGSDPGPELEVLPGGLIWGVNGHRWHDWLRSAVDAAAALSRPAPYCDLLWVITLPMALGWGARYHASRQMTRDETVEVGSAWWSTGHTHLNWSPVLPLLLLFARAAWRAAGDGLLLRFAAAAVSLTVAVLVAQYLAEVVRWWACREEFLGPIHIYHLDREIEGVHLPLPYVIEVLPLSRRIWSVNGLPTPGRRIYRDQQVGRPRE